MRVVSSCEGWHIWNTALLLGQNKLEHHYGIASIPLKTTDKLLIRVENIWTVCQKQYRVQWISKDLIKAFHSAIFVLLPKLGPSAQSTIIWFTQPNQPSHY